MKTMRPLPMLLIAACLALSACTTIRDGVIVEKRARIGMQDVYAEEFGFRYEPSVYWVRVEGKDDKGPGADQEHHPFPARLGAIARGGPLEQAERVYPGGSG